MKIGIKKTIPQWIKYPAWWILKSPQRTLGWSTLYLDLIGIYRYLVQQTSFKAKPKRISICVGIFNRTAIFEKNFLPSLVKCEHQELIELSVYDCGSSDVSILRESIIKHFKGKVVFKSEEVKFTRSYSFNQAVWQSTHEIVFLCDADFSIPQNIVQLCSSYTHKGSFWFPIVFYLYKNKPEFFAKENGEWMLWGGKGLLACTRLSFESIGGLSENFTSWGGEDEEFWLRCHQNGLVIIRNKEKGLLHHWHPSLNTKYKNLENLSDMGIL